MLVMFQASELREVAVGIECHLVDGIVAFVHQVQMLEVIAMVFLNQVQYDTARVGV